MLYVAHQVDQARKREESPWMYCPLIEFWSIEMILKSNDIKIFISNYLKMFLPQVMKSINSMF